jgi:hypothetical protein
MPPMLLSILRIAIILAFEIAAFFFFYNRPDGRKAVYFSWYAWIIDALAILSGGSIIAATIYALHNPQLFNFVIPTWVFVIAIIIGSWQATIHFVKILIRMRWRHHERKEE